VNVEPIGDDDEQRANASPTGSPERPLDYARVDPTEERREPRLSRLAVSSIVLAFFSLVPMCGCPPLVWMFRSVHPSYRWMVLIALPVASFVLSCVALVRIVRAMDQLRGEGLAITGIVVSFLICLMIVVATV
jgi:hypothetical protein